MNSQGARKKSKTSLTKIPIGMKKDNSAKKSEYNHKICTKLKLFPRKLSFIFYAEWDKLIQHQAR